MNFILEHYQLILLTLTGGYTMLNLLFGLISENRLYKVEKELDERLDHQNEKINGLNRELLHLRMRQDYLEKK